jgi:hypothetical protein
MRAQLPTSRTTPQTTQEGPTRERERVLGFYAALLKRVYAANEADQEEEKQRLYAALFRRMFAAKRPTKHLLSLL